MIEPELDFYGTAAAFAKPKWRGKGEMTKAR
jgi:hypothetical protein